jgi:hypothetical protein
MKTLLIAIAFIVLLGVGAVVIGLLLPKDHVATRSASFRATPDHLFSLIAGQQNWRPDVLRYETVPNSGARELVRETTRDGETITYELLDRVPPTLLKRRIATQNLPFSGSWTFSLLPDGEVTTVRITENGEVSNPVYRFMSRFVFGHTRTMDNYLQALARATGQTVEVKD